MLTVSMLQALQAWLPYRSLIKESIKRDGHAASVYTIVDTPVKTRDTQLTRAALSIRSVSNSRCNLQKPRSPTFAAIGAALTAPFANSNYHAEQNVCWLINVVHVVDHFLGHRLGMSIDNSVATEAVNAVKRANDEITSNYKCYFVTACKLYIRGKKSSRNRNGEPRWLPWIMLVWSKRSIFLFF